MCKSLKVNLKSEAVKALEVLKILTGKSDSENIEDAIETWTKRLLRELDKNAILGS